MIELSLVLFRVVLRIIRSCITVLSIDDTSHESLLGIASQWIFATGYLTINGRIWNFSRLLPMYE